MKKLYIVGLMVIATVSALAQGTVNFNNSVLPASGKVFLGDPLTGSALVGTNYVVQLYFGAPGTAASALQPVAATAVAHFRAAGTSLPGIWTGAPNSGNAVLTGFFNNGGANDPKNVSLEVRAWDIGLGATYAAAFAAKGGQGTGKSGVFSFSIPDSTVVNAPAAFFMSNMQGFSIVAVPEPSVIILGILGAGALLLRRRK